MFHALNHHVSNPWSVLQLQAVVVIGTLSFALYCYFYFDNVHFHITHGYAKLGYAPAQHQVGQRYLHGESSCAN